MKLRMGIACIHVLNDTRPILWVSKDPDLDPILACGRGDHDPEDPDGWGLSHLFHFTAGDPALGIVHTLRSGDFFLRERVGAPWRRLQPERDPRASP